MRILLITSALLSATSVFAQPGTQPTTQSTTRPTSALAEARLQDVAPFIDESMLLIIRVDAKSIDTSAIGATLERWHHITDTDPQEIAEADAQRDRQVAEAQQLLDAFAKAGGTVFYVLLNLTDAMAGSPFFMVIPVRPGSNEEKLSQAAVDLFAFQKDAPRQPASPGAARATRLRGSIVVAPAATTRRLQLLDPVARPDIAPIFESVKEAPVQVLWAPSAQMRQSLQVTLPMLAPSSSKADRLLYQALPTDLVFASLSVTLPPNLHLSLAMQAANEEGAKRLRAALEGSIRGNFEDRMQRAVKSGKITEARATQVMSSLLMSAMLDLVPKVAGSQLVLSLDALDVDKSVVKLGPPMAAARRAARRAFSANNIGQLIRTAYAYNQQHEGRWPDSLQSLASASRFGPDILVNPAREDMRPAYEYLRPVMPAGQMGKNQILIYERHDKWAAGINVGFVDGRVVFMQDNAEFQRLLAATKAANALPAAGTVPATPKE